MTAFPQAPNYAGDQVAIRDSAPASAVVAMSSGASAIKSGRAVFIDCTSVGTMTVTLIDTTTIVFTFPAVGIYEFNWAVTGYSLSGGAATVYNLY